MTHTLCDLLRTGIRRLEAGGVPNARRNAEWMMCRALECTPLYLHVNARETIEPEAARMFEAFVDRRAAREPLQHVLESTEFMSLPFVMERGVFIPRPETESVVEMAEQYLSTRPLFEPLTVLDLCCGSGVIGVSLATRIPNLRAHLVDTSPRAVQLSRRNALQNGCSARVEACRADAVSPPQASFVESWPARFTAVVCNPPYIACGELEALPPEVRDWDPPEALDGGPDGLAFYRAVVPTLRSRLIDGGAVFFEIGDAQGNAVGNLMRQSGFIQVTVARDTAGRDRVVSGTTPASNESKV